MIIQSLPAQAFVFSPIAPPAITDIRVVSVGGGNSQVQVKVVG